MRRLRLLLAVVVLAVAALVGSSPTSAASGTAAPFSISNEDLHDGAITEINGLFVLTGTEYACGFTWRQTNTPWCGFGYSTATSLSGPWSTPKLLFDPNSTDPWTGTSWVSECGSTGAGCFNPKAVVRSDWGANDGVLLLAFNSPADWNRNHSNAYDIMGCDLSGTTIGCGPGETVGPHGSYTKPSLNYCTGNGDFGLTVANGSLDMICTLSNQTLSEEQLNKWGTGTDGTGSSNLAGLTQVEGPGMWQDPASGTWLLSYSDPDCGYCSSAATGFASATSPLGPWTAPANAGQVSYPAAARRDITANSCGGQPRTVSVLDGAPYEGVDLWLGTANEAGAGLHYEPLVYNNPSAKAGDGKLWQPFQPWTCQ